MVSDSEPGERLEVTEVVFAADDRTPVAGASVYVYQTDARGYYRPDDAMGNRELQHIHYEVTAEGHGTRIFEIVFEDDPFVTAQIRGEAARPGSVYALRRVERGASGAGRMIQDVVLPAR